jgi:hypothetical protein
MISFRKNGTAVREALQAFGTNVLIIRPTTCKNFNGMAVAIGNDSQSLFIREGNHHE